MNSVAEEAISEALYHIGISGSGESVCVCLCDSAGPCLCFVCVCTMCNYTEKREKMDCLMY